MASTPLLADPQTVENLRLCCDALARAERSGHPGVMAQAALAVACAYRELQAPGAAELYLHQALAWARSAQAHDAVVEMLCELCELGARQAQALRATDPAAAHAQLERVRDLAFEAASRSAHVADAAWEVKVLLHVSDVLDRLGDHDDAAHLQARAMGLMSGSPVVHDASLMPALGRLADGPAS